MFSLSVFLDIFLAIKLVRKKLNFYFNYITSLNKRMENIKDDMNKIMSEEKKDVVMDDDLVHVKFVLDQSGSMEVMGKEPIQSLNNFIKEQKKDGDFIFTLCFFNHDVTIVKDSVHSSTLEDFKEEEYNPDGLTALFDAIGKTMCTGKESSKVIFIILSDGCENSSREYSRSMIKKITKEKESKGWKFIYLGANQDSYLESNKMGLRAGISCDYEYNDTGLRNVMRSTSDTVRVLRTQNFETSLTVEDEDDDQEIEMPFQPPTIQRTTSC